MYRIGYTFIVIACLCVPSVTHGQVVRQKLPPDATPEKEKQAKEEAVAEKKEPPKLILFEDNVFSVNSGAYLLTPYKISSNVLERADTEAAFFLQFSYDLVTAWNAERRYELMKDLPRDDRRMFFKPGKHFLRTPDFQASLFAFLHDNGDKATAATIVGSGDFAGEITASFPLFGTFFLKSTKQVPNITEDTAYDATRHVHMVSLVSSYSATTDRGSYDVHHRIFEGIGYRAAIKNPLDEKNREVLFDIRTGIAWIENADFVETDSRQISLKYGDVPDYDLKAGFALEAEVRFPFSDLGYLTFGARIYGNRNPNPWSASMGLTLPLDRLLKIASAE